MTRPARVAVTVEQCWHRVPGGTATSAIGMLRALRAHTDLDLVGVSARHGAPPAEPWRPPVPVRMLPLPRPALYEAWHRLRWPPVQWATGPVDVVHATGMAVPPRRGPLVVTVHDLAFLDDPGLFTARGVRFFHRSIDLARRHADLVTCPSQATVDACAAHGFDPARLRLVPWGHDLSADSGSAGGDAGAAVRRRYGVDGERPYVLWSGTIEPRKNVPVLVEAFGRLARAGRDDVDLVLAGPEGWNDELERVAGAVDGRRIHRTGFVPEGDLRALYAGAAVFAFPSRAEGFGLPVLEAMAQGTPVVTSAGTATAEIVGDSDAGVLVPAGDAGALAAALGALLDDPAERARRGDAARRRSRDFSWARTAGLLAAVYDEARSSATRAGRSVP
jgi:glycosyltransferase involved in cell wall biosynthesis